MSQITDDFEGELTAKCPRCPSHTFDEVMVNVTVSSPFKRVSLDIPGDIMEPDYERAENTGGDIDRYQCANCGHVVAKTAPEFVEWLKQNGTPCQ